MLYALRSDATRRRPGCASWSPAPITDDADHAEALALLRGSPALDAARATLAGYAETARSMLAALPDVPARAALEALTYTVLDRTG